MKRRLLIALALVGALVGAGVLVYPWLLGSDPTAGREAARTADAARRAPAAPPDAGAPSAAKVTGVSGLVEVSRAGGPWRPVAAGDELLALDVIRTGAGGSATLDVGRTATVQLDESSQFGASEISRTVSSVRLEGGRLSAQVHGEGGSRFRVEVRGSDAVAETGEGEFAVLSDDRGHVTVASAKGDVRLTARGEAVTIAADEIATVAPGAAPTRPSKIPPELFLKVGRPRSLVQREKQLAVVGQTTPGAVVSINGVRVDVGADGSFATTVALVEGGNAVTVRAHDVLGRRQQQETRVTVDTAAPKLKTGVTWGSP